MSSPPRVIVVTGASSGIGLAAARALAAGGDTVVLTARHPARLQAACRQIAGPVTGIPCDVAQRDQVESLMATVADQFGRLDVLLINAGVGLLAPVADMKLADARAVFETNFFGALHCVQAALPIFQRQRAGQLLFVSALAGLRALPNSALYSASKAALIAIADALRIELRQTGVRVTVVCPGRVAQTAFFDRATTAGPVQLLPAPTTLTAAELAATLVEAVRRPRSLIVVPGYARRLHWVNRFAPRVADWLLAKRLPGPA